MNILKNNNSFEKERNIFYKNDDNFIYIDSSDNNSL